jgi:hypothetical protein
MNAPPARGSLHAPGKEGLGEVAAQSHLDPIQIETSPYPSLCGAASVRCSGGGLIGLNAPPARGSLHAPGKEGPGEVAAQSHLDPSQIETSPCPSLCGAASVRCPGGGLIGLNSPPARGSLHAPGKEGPPSLCYGGQSWGRGQLGYARIFCGSKPPRAPPYAPAASVRCSGGGLITAGSRPLRGDRHASLRAARDDGADVFGPWSDHFPHRLREGGLPPEAISLRAPRSS